MTIDQKITERGLVAGYMSIDCAKCNGGPQTVPIYPGEWPDDVARRYCGVIALYPSPLYVARVETKKLQRLGNLES